MVFRCVRIVKVVVGAFDRYSPQKRRREIEFFGDYVGRRCPAILQPLRVSRWLARGLVRERSEGLGRRLPAKRALALEFPLREYSRGLIARGRGR